MAEAAITLSKSRALLDFDWLRGSIYLYSVSTSFLAHLFNMFYFSVGSLGGAFIIASSEKMTDSLHVTRNVWKDSFDDVITYKNNTFKVRYSLASFSDGTKSSARGGSVSVDNFEPSENQAKFSSVIC